MNILFVGIGSIAKKHIAALKHLGVEATLYALRSSRQSEPYPGMVDIYSYDELSQFHLDFIIISNPTSEHAATIRRLMHFQVPLFIEKPLFADCKHDDIVAYIKQHRILTYVACDMRFLDALRFVHDYVDARYDQLKINEVNVYCGSYLPAWRPGIDYRTCYSAIPELGGGVHIDLIHDIDYVYWIFGQPSNSYAIWRNVSSLGIRAYDYANYNLEYPTFCVNIVLNYYRCDAKRTMEIIFDDCTWTLDMLKNQVTDHKGKVVFQSEQQGSETYVAQMAYFLSLLKKKQTMSFNSSEEAYQVLNICLKNERC